MFALKTSHELEREYRHHLERRTLRVPLAIVLAAAYFALYVGGLLVMRYSYDQNPDVYQGQTRDPYLP